MFSLEAGKDFDVVVVSIDSREKPPLAAERKASFLERYRRPAAAMKMSDHIVPALVCYDSSH
jgi:cephalosporin hydroxylase